MSFDLSSQVLIENSLKEALNKFQSVESNIVITDIYFQLNKLTGELVILNDDDDILSSVIVQEWINLSNELGVVKPVLQNVLTTLQGLGVFENLCLLKPYSFVLIDDKKEVISELLLIDELETLLLDDGLLEGLEDELNEFLKKLLSN